MVDNNIMEKIQALLRMAEHPNSNPNEAAIALERAQDLLLKHNLSRSEVNTSNNTAAAPDGIGKIELKEELNLDWKSLLIHTIAKYNLCTTIKSPNEHKITLFGSYQNVLSVITMYNWICPQLETMNREFWSNYSGNERRQSWNKGFYMGATNTIGGRLREPFNNFTNSTGHDLVIYNSKALSTAVHKIFPHVVNSHVTSKSYDGYSSGRVAGGRVSFGNNSKISGGSLRLGAGS